MDRGLIQSVKNGVCFGAAGIAFIIAYHKWYTRKTEDDFDRKRVLRAYEFLASLGLDYGSSLADNYFHGYLELILPPPVLSKSNLGRVRSYIRKQELEDEVVPEKLFVIIHKNGFSPDTYEKNPRFSCREAKLEFEVAGRSGIRNRMYQTQFYRVESAEKNEHHITVAMEGAPCLRQLYEASRRNQELKSMLDIIITTFVSKVREKIESDGYCRDLCELIYVDEGPDGLDRLANELFERAKTLSPHRF